MVAYSFQKRFVPQILAGLEPGAAAVLHGEPPAVKRQTIRGDRLRHARPGEEMQLYTGLRTKHAKLIARVRCICVSRIEINFVGRESVTVDNTTLRDVPSLIWFARQDGFRDWADFTSFWREQHGDEIERFEGVLLRWEPIVKAEPANG